jgi:hypothetical protein
VTHLEHDKIVHFDFALADILTNSRQVLVNKLDNGLGGFTGQNLLEDISGRELSE